MPFLVGADLPNRPPGERFRALLARPQILQIPGAHTGMASLLAKAAGFEAVYVGGSAMTATMGLPDLGVITVEEVCFYIRQVARASGLPLLVDGDTGHGDYEASRRDEAPGDRSEGQRTAQEISNHGVPQNSLMRNIPRAIVHPLRRRVDRSQQRARMAQQLERTDPKMPGVTLALQRARDRRRDTP